MPGKARQKPGREQEILLGLVELHLVTGKPIGSKTLQTHGFQEISSATIRNYFMKLEKKGFLHQRHISGGRVPTLNAYKFYANCHLKDHHLSEEDRKMLKRELRSETKEIVRYLHHSTETLSQLARGAAFLSSPRFDQDFIVNLKLINIDSQRSLCVMVTSFGLVYTEILHTPEKLSLLATQRIESYFHFRLTGLDRPDLSVEEEALGDQLYHEILLRHIVFQSSFSVEDTYQTGFSRLLQYPEFQEAAALAASLAAFERKSLIHGLLEECIRAKALKCWIGDELEKSNSSTSIIAIPYSVHEKPVGAIGVLVPVRAPYPKLFSLLRTFSDEVGHTLTVNLHKYHITYQEPMAKQISDQTHQSSSCRISYHGLALRRSSSDQAAKKEKDKKERFS